MKLPLSLLPRYAPDRLLVRTAGSNGITDTFLNPKPGVAPYIKQFNARSIFLQDGLQLSYASGEQLSVDISLSNYGDGVLPTTAELTWEVLLDGKSLKTATAAVTKAVPQGSLGVVGTVSLALPDVGTTASVAFGATDGPKTLTITAVFASSSGSFANVPLNSWCGILTLVLCDIIPTLKNEYHY